MKQYLLIDIGGTFIKYSLADEQARKICGDSVGLKKLVDFWMPRQMILNDVYDKVFALIDEKTKMMA